MKFSIPVVVEIGCDRVYSRAEITRLISKAILSNLPKDLVAGSTICVAIDIRFSIPFYESPRD